MIKLFTLMCLNDAGSLNESSKMNPKENEKYVIKQTSAQSIHNKVRSKKKVESLNDIFFAIFAFLDLYSMLW